MSDIYKQIALCCRVSSTDSEVFTQAETSTGLEPVGQTYKDLLMAITIEIKWPICSGTCQAAPSWALLFSWDKKGYQFPQ